VWETYVLASERLDRDLCALGIGVVAALLGLGAVLRATQAPGIGSSFPGGGGAVPSTGNGLSTVAVAGWTAGKAVALSAFGLLLAVFFAIAVSLALRGAPPTPEAFDQVRDRTLDVVAAAVRMLW
jgi:hypothetical protein